MPAENDDRQIGTPSPSPVLGALIASQTPPSEAPGLPVPPRPRLNGQMNRPVLDADSRLTDVRPSPRQLAWQAREFYGFLHFGMNTMTDAEWGDGTESADLFNPRNVDADQWVAACAAAGMTGVILTAKHHDGFCLWPTSTTSHSVASSPWRAGQGDLVREVAEAAARHDLAFGIYLSPWDRNHPTYGSGTAYDDVYATQLTELLTSYGPIFTLWFDGANGEGPTGAKQYYDWDRYYALIREHQPDAVISICGPDVRWCGNEAGHTRSQEWSVVPRALQDAERTASLSQQADDGEFSRKVDSRDDDLGSRTALAGHENDLVWYPAEVDTSIRPGWFHHSTEDDAVRTAEELIAIYRQSVGGNATLLLNVPPDRTGRVCAVDVAVLAELGHKIRALKNSAIPAVVTASSGEITGSGEQPWWRAAAADPTPTLRFDLPEPTALEAVVLKEAISEGQRIESVTIRGRIDGVWRDLAEAGCLGYQRIIDLDGVKADAVEVTITASRGVPVLAEASVLRR